MIKNLSIFLLEFLSLYDEILCISLRKVNRQMLLHPLNHKKTTIPKIEHSHHIIFAILILEVKSMWPTCGSMALLGFRGANVERLM